MKAQGLLFQVQDKGYRDFQSKLIPTIPAETIIGVRTPAIRKLAKEYAKDPESAAFLMQLPHTYYDENILHALLIAEIKDYDACMEAVEAFLPYIDNWAVCDGLSPKAFGKHNFQMEYPEKVMQICSKEYYVNMMTAWFFATALAKQWNAAIPYLEQNRLDPWTHNKTIQKARESYRITTEQKEYLKRLKVIKI